jgi:UDP-N-acetylglucosamine 2-epimerase (non-hydrolysing)
MEKPVILVLGTRAEAIKLIPLHEELKKLNIRSLICATFQHMHLLKQVFEVFNIKPDFNLNIMKEDQDLFYITQNILEKTKNLFSKIDPSLIVVQGDTTTSMASAMSAFYLKIPVAHVEAGLRTDNIHQPFPEEMNRRVISQMTTYHFAPTSLAVSRLIEERFEKNNIFCTGNTVVDALKSMLRKIESKEVTIDSKIKKLISTLKNKQSQIVLLTMHRRESFGQTIIQILEGIKEFANDFQDTAIIFPFHPNPNVAKAIEHTALKSTKNIFLFPAINYKDFVFLMKNASWIATDSGGIQEEAVSLGKKVLVMRDLTERPEGIQDGTEMLVGTNKKSILQIMKTVYHTKDKIDKPSNVFGDGKASVKIASIIKEKLGLELQKDIAEKHAAVKKL